MLDTVLTAAASFALCKSLFALLGWYSKSGADALYRRQLDSVWDLLHKLSLTDLVHHTIQRMLDRVRQTIRIRSRLFAALYLLFICINVVSIFVGLLLVNSTPSLFRSGLLVAIQEFFERDDVVSHEFLILLLLTSIPLAVFDLLSLWLSWRFLRAAASSKTLLTALLHIAADLLVVGIAGISSLIVFVVINSMYTYGQPMGESLASVTLVVASATDDSSMEVALYCAITGATAALPTVCHLLVGLVSVTAHFSPDFVRRIGIKVVLLVTTDDKPVFSQLGTFLGGISAVLAAGGSIVL